MKPKNAVLPLICSLLMAAAAIILGAVDKSDGTASILVLFFAVAVAIEAAECISHNIKRRKAKKKALRQSIQSLKHKSA